MKVDFQNDGSVSLANGDAHDAMRERARQDAMRDFAEVNRESIADSPVIDFIPETVEEAIMLATATANARR